MLLANILEEAKSPNAQEANYQRNKEYERKLQRKQQINNSAINPLETLNKEQLNASTSTSKNNLIIASAGTGKTSTIIGRVYYLLNVKKYKPNEIILLTFTAKAGHEMLERLEKYFDKEIVDDIFAGTFHAFGKKMMGEEKKRCNLLNEHKTNLILESLLNEYGINKETIKARDLFLFYGLFSNMIDKRESEDELFGFIQEKAWSLLKRDLTSHRIGILSTINNYELEKRKYGYSDFNDLLYYVKNSINSKTVTNLKEIIVDEYQDTNRLQNNILEDYERKGSNLFAVGDYDQSIYGFNGSDISILANFINTYKDVSVLSLTKNYRSCKSILDLAERVISNNKRIFPKGLEAMKEKNCNHAPKCYQFECSFDEHTFVVEKILLEQDYDNTAVIYRSNAIGDAIEKELLERNVNVDRKDSSNFLNTKDIQIFISTLKLIHYPKCDVFDVMNTFNYSSIPKKQLKRFYDNAKILGDNIFNRGIFHPNQGRTNKLNSADTEKTPLSQAHQKKANELGDSYICFYNSIDTVHFNTYYNLVKVLKDIAKCPTPTSALEKLKKSEYFNITITRLARERETNQKVAFIEAKDYFLKRFDTLLKIASFTDTYAKLFLKQILAKTEEEDKSGVKLLSAHGSKGLEFETVFLIHITNKKFPNENLIKKGSTVEEERRLMYVALTRAKTTLYITSSKLYGQREHTLSRFINEMGVEVQQG